MCVNGMKDYLGEWKKGLKKFILVIVINIISNDKCVFFFFINLLPNEDLLNLSPQEKP